MGRVKKVERITEPTNGGAQAIGSCEPYSVTVSLEGSSDMLFHRWNCESIEAKAAAGKNSKAKKSDDLESYVWRNNDDELCIPGEYLRQSMIHASKFRQDPRSPRKSAADLYKAAIVSNTHLASLGCKTWDYLDKRRVTIQRNGINRTRPAMRVGWEAEFSFTVLLPEYIDKHAFQDVLTNAGKLIGVGDFRPTFGRFTISKFKVS